MVATSHVSRSARGFLRTFLLSLMVSVFFCLSDTATAPHLPPPLLGIHPEIRAQWETGGSATCDGRSLDLTSINDGVCDCADGRCVRPLARTAWSSQPQCSDEPATGACSNSHFFCPNIGHQGTLIAVSRVNGEGGWLPLDVVEL